MTLKYPNCRFCKALRKALPSEIPDEMINDYHLSKITCMDFPNAVQAEVMRVIKEVYG
jgi:hypothetical protein